MWIPSEKQKQFFTPLPPFSYLSFRYHSKGRNLTSWKSQPLQKKHERTADTLNKGDSVSLAEGHFQTEGKKYKH